MSTGSPRDFQLAELVAEKVLGWQRMPSRRTWRRPLPERGSYLVRNCSLWGLVTDEGRILRDWVAAQLALVEAGSAESEEVFLPYLLVAGRGQTLFEQFQEHRADRLLGAGDVAAADVVG